MTKKLIALVEVLMVVSLFCTGFASWAILLPNDQSPPPTGTMIAYGVAQHDAAYLGISLAVTANDGKAAQAFRYSTTTAASSSAPTHTFISKTLSIFIVADHAKMAERLTADDYRSDVVLINCHTEKDSAVFPIAAGSDTSYSWESNKLVYNRTCKLTLNGYSNIFVMADVAARADGSLDISIPVEQIYNMVLLDKLNTDSSYLELEISFTDAGFTNSKIPTPCGYTPIFTVQTVGI